MAYLEAQLVKEVDKKAEEIFPELKSFQRIIFNVKCHGGYKWNKSPKLFYFIEKIGDYLVVIVPDSNKTVVYRELCDTVNKKEGEQVASIAESVYSHLAAKKPESLWIVGILSGCVKIAYQDWEIGFHQWHQWKNNPRIVYFNEIIGSWLVIITPKPSEPSNSLSNIMENLKVY